MANFIVGDVQGCFDELQLLLVKINFQPATDHMYFVGDLVNRGPRSLDVLRWVYQNRNSISIVLGNHDLFLLACWLGFATPRSGDTITEVLSAPDVGLLLNWLIQQPLMLAMGSYVVVHAGIYPGWTCRKALKLAEQARLKYSGPDRHFWFSNMFGNKPDQWAKTLSEVEKFRFTINAFTRMRFCDGSALDFKFKGEIESAPVNLMPWYCSPEIQIEQQVIFGHWSALGLQLHAEYICLDTGCIWGGQLTAYNLDEKEVISVSALRVYQDVCAEK